jgi:CelD/BcsL family acetyltransferase involved in cellulose biosynthesis
MLKESTDNNIYLTWEWLFTWWCHFGSHYKLKILLIRESGKIVGIAPLMLSKYGKGIFSVNVIENICAVNGCDYSDIIVDKNKPQALDILVDYLENLIRKNKVILRISNIPENSGFLLFLQKKYFSIPRYVRLIEHNTTSCPYITLPATWEDYIRTFPKRRRWHLKQKRNKLRKNHVVELVKIQDLKIYERMCFLFELHRQRWQGSSVSNLFTKPKVRQFYLDVSEIFHHNNWLDLSFLHIDGKPASGCWAFVYNGTFYDHTIAFNPSYSKYSAGTVHMLMLIEDAIQNGLKKFDMLKGAEEYKFRYANSKTVCSHLLMATPSIGGRYHVVLMQIINKLNNIRSRSLKENLQLALKRFKKLI